MKSSFNALLGICILIAITWSCANIGSPQGGPKDMTPPKVLYTEPAMNAYNNTKQKVVIHFDEFVKLDNASEKVIVSPPQTQQPEITVNGKSIVVKLQDSLKANSTYSIDFSDAITDNNEGNPLGNYAFTFSTGSHIDTLEVSGYLIDAETLEPIKGTAVGLHSDLSDSAFIKKPLDRVARTDSRGHFVIKGIAAGKYHVYALKDVDQNSRFNQRSEAIAFNDSLIVPSFRPDVRQDTSWVDSLSFDTVFTRPYTHYYPDNILLRSFTEKSITQYLIKSERSLPQLFALFFAIRNDTLPTLRGLNFNEKNAFIVQKNADNDTILYWIKDSLIYKLDTLKIQAKYLFTDTLNKFIPRTDTLKLYIKKYKNAPKKEGEHKKKDDKLKIIPLLPVAMATPSSMDIFDNIKLLFQEPISKMDTSMIHLFEKVDSVWKPKPYLIRQDSSNILAYNILAEWDPGKEYNLSVDSMAIHGLYGLHNGPLFSNLKMKTVNDYANLFFNITGVGPHAFVEVMDAQGKVIRKADVIKGRASIYYLNPGKVYARVTDDRNNNGKWDTGDYITRRQPEEVYYYPHVINLKAMWDIDQNWNVQELPLYKQKPDELKKQKPDQNKSKKYGQNSKKSYS